jgi:hypothetical protein
LVDNENEFIRKREDVITLRTGRECAGFDTLIESMLFNADVFLTRFCACPIIGVRSPPSVHG